MRLVTWNIWNGGEGRIEAIERVLREQDADVVALQEANDRAGVERLASSLEMELVYGEGNSEYAVAWLSRLPVVRSRNHRLPVLEKTLLEVEVAGRPLWATHLSAGRTLAHEPRRIAEAEAIVAQLVADGDVLVGDFNAIHPRDEVGAPVEELEHVSRRPVELLLEAGLLDSFRELHPDDPGWTYVAWQPWARLDYVLSRELPRSCEVVESDASDHFALVADL
ncbi:MAG: endonuclease/exonuclease/phosphatase family protein [Gaiellaceae bacterium]